MTARSQTLLKTVAAAIATVTLAASWVALQLPRRALVSRRLERDGVPMVFRARNDAEAAPGVLILHGFGSSQQVMSGFALTLAHAGYAVLTLDFSGHGANPLPLDRESGSLQGDVDTGYETLVDQPEVDPRRIAVLGHSMGSGAAMAAAIRNPERFAATIAVSPTDADVSAQSPPNLLLMAGTWEESFLENARDLLMRAGGPATIPADFAAGQARDLVPIGNVEHITILLSAQSHEAARAFLDSSFRLESGPVYRDRRVLWVAMQFIAWMVLAVLAAPAAKRLTGAGPAAEQEAGRRRHAWWIAGVLAPFAATAGIAVLASAADFGGFGGVLVGGTISLWFLVAGGLWLGAGSRPNAPSVRALLGGVGVFIVLWLAVGLAAHQVLMNWLLTPARLLRWPVVALFILPWSLAAGYAQSGRPAWQRLLVFVGQTIAVVAALAIAGLTVPGLYFVVLLLPALPLALGAGAVVGGAADRAWAFGIGNALFLGWMLMAVFPVI